MGLDNERRLELLTRDGPRDQLAVALAEEPRRERWELLAVRLTIVVLDALSTTLDNYRRSSQGGGGRHAVHIK